MNSQQNQNNGRSCASAGLLVTALVLWASSSQAMTQRLQAAPVAATCMVGGCSGQLCLDSVDGGGMVSNCMYKDYYACYAAFGECKRQLDGNCGWTKTTELNACIANPPALTHEPSPK